MIGFPEMFRQMRITGFEKSVVQGVEAIASLVHGPRQFDDLGGPERRLRIRGKRVAKQMAQEVSLGRTLIQIRMLIYGQSCCCFGFSASMERYCSSGIFSDPCCTIRVEKGGAGVICVPGYVLTTGFNASLAGFRGRGQPFFPGRLIVRTLFGNQNYFPASFVGYKVKNSPATRCPKLLKLALRDGQPAQEFKHGGWIVRA